MSLQKNEIAERKALEQLKTNAEEFISLVEKCKDFESGMWNMLEAYMLKPDCEMHLLSERSHTLFVYQETSRFIKSLYLLMGQCC